MAQFPRPIYVDTRSNVMIGGKSSEQTEADLAAGVARVGGFIREPSYFESYLHAAQALIDKGRADGNLDDLGMPAFYLQRHTLELLLKSVLSWLHSIDDLKKRILNVNFQPDLDARDKNVNKHSHRKLLDMVLAAAKELELPEPPSELETLVERFTSFEQTGTWARYSSSRMRGHEKVQHLENEVVIPLVDLQSSLADLAARVISRDLDAHSYENVLVDEWDYLNQQVENMRSVQLM